MDNVKRRHKRLLQREIDSAIHGAFCNMKARDDARCKSLPSNQSTNPTACNLPGQSQSIKQVPPLELDLTKPLGEINNRNNIFPIHVDSTASEKECCNHAAETVAGIDFKEGFILRLFKALIDQPYHRKGQYVHEQPVASAKKIPLATDTVINERTGATVGSVVKKLLTGCKHFHGNEECKRIMMEIVNDLNPTADLAADAKKLCCLAY
jgi:hypothetical protein